MAELTAEQITQQAFNLSLLDDRQLQAVWGELGRRDVPADELIQLLMRRELMTNFQLERMLRGERTGYYYGDYKVLYMVAAGTFARVYRAVHRETGRVVALKVLRKRYCDDPEQVEHFLREGHLSEKLRHPNIVPVYDVQSQGRNHFFVMEFVEGFNLREFLKARKKFQPIEATRLVADMAAGLRYAAEHGVFHRDLKLTNVLVASSGQAKLVDFGLAGVDKSTHRDDDDHGLNQRTIDYAGLERATGVRKNDPRSDIYFVGCIYYYLLTGKSPLVETRDRIQRLAKSRFTEVVPINKIDPSLPLSVTSIVRKAMEFDPNKRYQLPAQMLVDLNIAMKRLAAGDVTTDVTVADEALQKERKRAAALLDIDGQRRTVMVVESNTRFQDAFREMLKKDGYRALVLSDPQRALGRFEDDEKLPADCVIFGTSQLGETAIEAFLNFAEGQKTSDLPAVLLLDPDHRAWQAKLAPKLSKRRIVVPMPVKIRQLRKALSQLVPIG